MVKDRHEEAADLWIVIGSFSGHRILFCPSTRDIHCPTPGIALAGIQVNATEAQHRAFLPGMAVPLAR
jgi:hypothetical protein